MNTYSVYIKDRLIYMYIHCIRVIINNIFLQVQSTLYGSLMTFPISF